MKTFTSPVTLLMAALALGGCAPAEEEETTVADCDSVPVPTYGELTIWSTCTGCHASTLTGSARKLAPAGVNFDSYAAAAAQARQAAAEVGAGTMPPAGQTKPSDDQKTALVRWAACGSPN